MTRPGRSGRRGVSALTILAYPPLPYGSEDRTEVPGFEREDCFVPVARRGHASGASHDLLGQPPEAALSGRVGVDVEIALDRLLESAPASDRCQRR